MSTAHAALPLPPAPPHKRHLLLACTGSVATIKLPQLLAALTPHTPSLAIIILLTPTAARFLAGQSAEQPTLSSLLSAHTASGLVLACHQDADEWNPPWHRGAGVLHIELRKWADLLVVAPLSADAMSEMVHGGCKGLVGSVIRAWDTRARDGKGRRRIVVAPAMNTAMWEHPVTERLLGVLEGEWGVMGNKEGWVEVLRPVEKELACGDVGVGAMADWRVVVAVVERRLGLVQSEGGAEQGKDS